MDISSLNGYTDQLISSAEQSQAKQKLEKIQNALTSAASGKSGEVDNPELMDACKTFEAYFLEQVFKEMEKTVPEHDYGDQATNNLVDYFKGNTIQSMAEQVADGEGLGLARQLYEQMSRNAAATVSPEELAKKTAAAVSPEELAEKTAAAVSSEEPAEKTTGEQ